MVISLSFSRTESTWQNVVSHSTDQFMQLLIDVPAIISARYIRAGAYNWDINKCLVHKLVSAIMITSKKLSQTESDVMIASKKLP